MNREIILTRLPVGGQRVLSYLRMENGRAVQIELEPPSETERTGNIYMGRIEKIVPQLKAAFVRMYGDRIGFLPLAKARHCICRIPRPDGSLKEQDELLVQIEREAIRGKLPSLKTALEFPGKFLVLLTDHTGIFYSPRLEKEQKERIGQLLKKWMEEKELTFGILARTNAGSASEEELQEEWEKLYEQASAVCRYGVTRAAGTCLRRPPAFWQELLEGLPRGESTRILTDEKEILQQLNSSTYRKASEDGDTIMTEWYGETLQPLYKKYGLEELLTKATETRVELPSGGFLMIEQTEAFAAVDVNSGRSRSAQDSDEFYFQVNREAAVEIVHQLRLRNLSGTILIDFINMKEKARLEQLFLELQRGFRKDPVRTTAVDITALKIIEVTRQKVRRPLYEQVAYYCQENREIAERKGGSTECCMTGK